MNILTNEEVSTLPPHELMLYSLMLVTEVTGFIGSTDERVENNTITEIELEEATAKLQEHTKHLNHVLYLICKQKKPN